MDIVLEKTYTETLIRICLSGMGTSEVFSEIYDLSREEVESFVKDSLRNPDSYFNKNRSFIREDIKNKTLRNGLYEVVQIQMSEFPDDLKDDIELEKFMKEFDPISSLEFPQYSGSHTLNVKDLVEMFLEHPQIPLNSFIQFSANNVIQFFIMIRDPNSYLSRKKERICQREDLQQRIENSITDVFEKNSRSGTISSDYAYFVREFKRHFPSQQAQAITLAFSESLDAEHREKVVNDAISKIQSIPPVSPSLDCQTDQTDYYRMTSIERIIEIRLRKPDWDHAFPIPTMNQINDFLSTAINNPNSYLNKNKDRILARPALQNSFFETIGWTVMMNAGVPVDLEEVFFKFGREFGPAQALSEHQTSTIGKPVQSGNEDLAESKKESTSENVNTATSEETKKPAKKMNCKFISGFDEHRTALLETFKLPK